MSLPQQRPDTQKGLTLHKPPVFKTASGKLYTATPGQRIELDDVERLVDICIVFDTTGSMSNKIEGLVRCMVEFVGELDRLKLSWRFSVVPFGDLTIPGDRVVGDLPFVTSHHAAEQMIKSLPRFNGGGNIGESSLEAMQAAMAKPYRDGAVKVLVVLTDDYPLTSPQLAPATIGQELRRREFVCFVASEPNQGYEPWAKENAGTWYPIGSSVDISEMLAFLKGLLKEVAKVSKAIFVFGGGSVNNYILTEAERRKSLGS